MVEIKPNTMVHPLYSSDRAAVYILHHFLEAYAYAHTFTLLDDMCRALYKKLDYMC